VLKTKLLVLLALTFLIYLPSFGNHFIWDDEQFIYKNTSVLNFDLPAIFTESTTAGAGIASNYYRPLTSLSFAIDHAIWGLKPFGFHLTNTLLHAGAGILLYLLLTQIGIGSKSNSIWKDPAFWLSLIFLVHPIQTEAVVYINSRGDSLSALLAFTCLLMFAKVIRKTPDQQSSLLPNQVWPVYITGIFLLAMLAKEIAISTVALIFQIYWQQFVLEKNRKNHQLNHRIARITLVAASALATTYFFLRLTVFNFQNTVNFYTEATEYSQSLAVRMLTFSKAIWIYWKLLLFPYPLHMERDLEIVNSLASIWPWLSFGAILLLFIAGDLERIKHSTTWIWFGSAWFALTISPVSGIIPINGMIYEHWQYLPMIGFFIVLWRILSMTLRKFTLTNKFISFSKVFLIVVTIALGLFTIRQNWLWRNPISFYTYLLRYTDSARIRNNLGIAYADGGQIDQAIEQYTYALEFNNSYPQIYHNLANLYSISGKQEKAIEYYQLALERDPQFIPTLINLTELYQQLGKTDEAAATAAALEKLTGLSYN